MRPGPAPRPVGLVVLGGSWGGLDAACGVLERLPAPLPVSVLLVLHRSRRSCGDTLAEVVLGCSGHVLSEVEDKQPLRAGQVLLAPPDYHLLVEDGAAALSTEAPVNSCRPSIDLTLETAAEEYGGALVAVLLSGAGQDGAWGMRRVKDGGGRTLVQAPASAERSDMPQAAVDTGAVDEIGEPAVLGARLAQWLGEGAR